MYIYLLQTLIYELGIIDTLPMAFILHTYFVERIYVGMKNEIPYMQTVYIVLKGIKHL